MVIQCNPFVANPPPHFWNRWRSVSQPPISRRPCIKLYCVLPVCSVFLARLVIADRGTPMTLRTESILIRDNGELHIGSESHPYISPLDVVLHGRSSDPGQHPLFGNKYIGVMATGSLEIHGLWKRSWTLLEATVQPGTCERKCSLWLSVRRLPFYNCKLEQLVDPRGWEWCLRQPPNLSSASCDLDLWPFASQFILLLSY